MATFEAAPSFPLTSDGRSTPSPDDAASTSARSPAIRSWLPDPHSKRPPPRSATASVSRTFSSAADASTIATAGDGQDAPAVGLDDVGLVDALHLHVRRGVLGSGSRRRRARLGRAVLGGTGHHAVLHVSVVRETQPVLGDAGACFTVDPTLEGGARIERRQRTRELHRRKPARAGRRSRVAGSARARSQRAASIPRPRR